MHSNFNSELVTFACYIRIVSFYIVYVQVIVKVHHLKMYKFVIKTCNTQLLQVVVLKFSFKLCYT